MRLEGRMRLGYFPLHQREAQRMRRFLQFPNEPFTYDDTGRRLYFGVKGKL